MISTSGLTLPTETEAQYRARRALAAAAAIEQASRATLDNHCPHEDLNHDKSRCLTCGLWL